MSFFSYGKVEFWEKRYTQDPEPFEWYHKFLDIEPHIQQYLGSNKKVLVIGCGNSSLSDDLYQRNIKDVISIDTSQSVVKYMTTKNYHLKQMDVRNMNFEPDSFDLVIDKACMDCIFCGENSFENCQKALQSIYDVLNKTGVFICLSNSFVEHRLPFFSKMKWDVETKKVEKPELRMVDMILDKEIPNHYNFFICKKDL